MRGKGTAFLFHCWNIASLCGRNTNYTNRTGQPQQHVIDIHSKLISAVQLKLSSKHSDVISAGIAKEANAFVLFSQAPSGSCLRVAVLSDALVILNLTWDRGRLRRGWHR